MISELGLENDNSTKINAGSLRYVHPIKKRLFNTSRAEMQRKKQARSRDISTMINASAMQ
jgi:hypothetical protein